MENKHNLKLKLLNPDRHVIYIYIYIICFEKYMHHVRNIGKEGHLYSLSALYEVTQF